MSKYRDLLERCETLVIFKSLKEDEVVHALLETLAAAEDECSDSVSWYCEFVSLLYKHGDNLTKYILKLVLENENLYMLRRGSGEQTGELLDECLANELFLLEELAEISCSILMASCRDIIPKKLISPKSMPTAYIILLNMAMAFTHSITFL